ncbi:MAG: hypothetical protein HQL62_00895 [Magnetococcales bacterium]|nr:hypothetical protein [Magnetococcales bacterium]
MASVVYAPLAAVNMLGNSTLIGGMWGRVISKDQGTPNFFYDEDLKDIPDGSKGVIAVGAWQELY